MQLSPREEQIAYLTAEEGRTNKQIAKQAGLTEGTVKFYKIRLCKKLEVSTSLELAAWYWKREISKLKVQLNATK